MRSSAAGCSAVVERQVVRRQYSMKPFLQSLWVKPYHAWNESE
jgi:hypothetical protein